MKWIGAILLIFLLLLALNLNSCKEEIEPHLLSAEQDMDLNPDSVLAVLNSIDPNRLSAHNKAIYYLLRTQALDKTNSLDDDTAQIDAALEYFNAHGTDKEKMMANFYRGRYYLFAGDNKRAMSILLSARDISKRVKDYYWYAKVAEFIADIYSFSETYQEAWKYEEEAIKYYLKARRIDNHRYALADHGLSLFLGGNVKRGVDICDSIKRVAKVAEDDDLNIYVSQYLLYIHMELKNFTTASDVFSQLCEFKDYTPSSADLCSAALLSAIEGYNQKSSEFLTSAKQNITSAEDSLDYYFSSLKIADLKNDKDNRAAYLDSTLLIQNHIVKKLLQRPALKASEEYYHEKAIKEEYKSSLRLATLVFVIVVFIMLSLVGWQIGLNRFHKKEVAMLELSINYENLKLRNDTLSSNIIGILGSRFEMLNLLLPEVMEDEKNEIQRKIILNNVEKEIKSWTTPQKIRQIEETLNKYLEDACKKIRSQCPFFKESDYKIIFYLWSGFSPKSVSLLLSLNIKTLYTTRSRIIKKIEASDVEDKNLFLKLFGK